MRKLEKLLDKVRGWALNFWLVMVYVTVLIPAGFARRILGRGFPPRDAQRGWQKTSQRASDKRMFKGKF